MNMVQAITAMGGVHFTNPDQAKFFVRKVQTFSKTGFLKLEKSTEQCEAATYIADNWDDYQPVKEALNPKKGKRK